MAYCMLKRVADPGDMSAESDHRDTVKRATRQPDILKVAASDLFSMLKLNFNTLIRIRI